MLALIEAPTVVHLEEQRAFGKAKMRKAADLIRHTPMLA